MATPFPFVSGNTLTAAQMNAITTLPLNDQTASYVAVVGDVGKRIVMNVASSNTVTINNSIFAAGDTIFIANKGAGTTTVTAGAGVTINTSGSLALAQYGGGTLVALSASVFTFFNSVGASYGTATGGTSSSITVGGQNYTLLTFTSSGTLTVTKAGLFDIGIVGGGGGSAASNTTYTSIASGGAGGGGWYQVTMYLTANEAIVVGAGGATQEVDAGTGYVGVGGGIKSILLHDSGGGSTSSPIGGDGITGGGGGYSVTAGTAIYNDANRTIGYSGGNGSSGGLTNGAGGGGGGATSVGGAGTLTGASGIGGNGGAGYDVSAFIGGSTLSLGGGGGGGGKATGGTGNGGGGNGGTNGRGVAGTINTGGGGGGATNGQYGRAGGSGIVYIRFKV